MTSSTIHLPTTAPLSDGTLRRSVVVYVALLTAGAMLGPISLMLGPAIFPEIGISEYFATFQDSPVALVIALSLAVPLLRANTSRADVVPAWLASAPSRVAIVTAAGVTLVVLVGTDIVFAREPLSLDEFYVWFDARIFSTGHLMVPVPMEWRDKMLALQPEQFLLPVPDNAYWVSAYLPVNALIRAAFDLLGDGRLAPVALAIGCVPLFHAVSGKIFPSDPVARSVGLILFVTSSQFLVTAMTPYAMTAHLAFNLAWLWLFLHGRRWSHGLNAAVSLAACGLHQVIFHPLFVAPFILLMLADKRFALAAYYTSVLAVCGLFWIEYGAIAVMAEGAGHGASGPGFGYMAKRVLDMLAYAADPISAWHMSKNFFRLLSWQNPAEIVLIFVALAEIRRWPRVFLALAGGFVLCVMSVAVLLPIQGHGWGYRYVHGMLGNLALIAAYGWRSIWISSSNIRAAAIRTFLISVVLSIGVLLPWRAMQAHSFAHPVSSSVKAIAAADADVVIVDTTDLWYARDLVRNDPLFRNKPITLYLTRLSVADIRSLCQNYRIQIFDRTNPITNDFIHVPSSAAARSKIRELRAELVRNCPYLPPFRDP